MKKRCERGGGGVSGEDLIESKHKEKNWRGTSFRIVNIAAA